MGLASYFKYCQKRTDIFCYFYFEIVHRHIQISPPNPVISWFNNGIQMNITLGGSLKLNKTLFFFSPNWGLWWQWQKCWPNINKSTLRWFQILPLWIHMPCRTCKYLQSNFFFKLWFIVLIFLTWCSIIMIFLFDPITLVMTKILTYLLWWLLNNNNCVFSISIFQYRTDLLYIHTYHVFNKRKSFFLLVYDKH